jgi:lipid-A-disaccharide synthase
MGVRYRIGPLTYAILKRIVRTKWITLFNIAAGRTIAPELIQEACTGEALAREAGLRLDDAVLRASQVTAQFEALDKMGRGGGDPAARAADAVLAVARRKNEKGPRFPEAL